MNTLKLNLKSGQDIIAINSQLKSKIFLATTTTAAVSNGSSSYSIPGHPSGAGPRCS